MLFRSAVYQYYADRGDMQTAQKAAASLLLASQSQSRQLSALASELVRNGDTSRATKALVASINAIPDGRVAKEEGGKVIIKDAKSGQTVDGFEITPQQILQAANGHLRGDRFFNDLIATASGKPIYTQPDGVSPEEEQAR